MRAAAKAGTCLAAILMAAVPMAAVAAPHPASATPPAGPARTVTLITGDRLLVSLDGRAASRLRSPGRDAVPLLSQFAGGHLEVVPADAVALLGADRLDHRLFDVTRLLADRDGDAVPLIITHDQGDPASVVRTAAGGADVRDLDTINALSVRVPAARTATMWQSLTGGALSTAYRKVWLDGLARPSIDVSVPLVGAPAAWAAGYTGAGVPVGVLDTGVDAAHPDLAQAVAASADFTGGGADTDRAGHGTHVASIIAGSGAASGGRFRGMAPDAQIYSGRVCRADGCPESAIVAGMQWAARDEGLRVVNLSLDQPDEPGTDLLEQAVGTLSARYGTLFVVAAGNGGRVASPASADAALAVGATTKDDTLARFSDSGPRIGDGALKPDIVAPGVDIVAARSRASSLPPAGPGGSYTRLSGTSLAAPHVAGAAALLAQQHPDWAAADLKAALMNSATPLAGAGVDRAGAGRLDVAQAVASPVLAEPGSLSFGSTGAEPARTVTYRNDGTAPVTLDLAAGGGLRLDTAQVTVPPRGAAPVVVRAVPGPRRLTSVLTATGAGLSIRTPVAVDAQSDKVRLTVRWTDRAGGPAQSTLGGLYAPDGSRWYRLPRDGSIEVPRGTYTLDAKILGDGVTVLDQPRLVLDKDTTVDLDARLGRPVRVASPRAGSAQVWAHVGVTSGAMTANVQATTFDGVYTAQIGGGGDAPGFRTDVSASWARPGANSPYLYSLAWPQSGRFVTGFARSATPQDLATVHAEYARDAPTGTMTLPFADGDWGYASTMDLPMRRTEYFTAGAWSGRFGSAQSPPTVYTAGRDYDVTWNRGVFGPAFPSGYAATRTGDSLHIDPAWFSDSAGDHGDASPEATHHLTVLRDGATVDATAAPAGAGEFTVTDESTRSATYSTSTRTTWTFRSARTAKATALPLSTIRFVPAGEVLAFTVARQPGSAAAPVAAFTLQVSYDDGLTWRTALASRVGARGIAILRPPAAGRFVSLKASATDTAGNRVDQTIIRAYQ